MGAAAFGSAGLESIGQTSGSRVVNNSIGATAVDQNPIRRRGTGLRALDVDRASAGLTLFASVGGWRAEASLDWHRLFDVPACKI